MNPLNFRKNLKENQPNEDGLVFENTSLMMKKKPYSIKKIWRMGIGSKAKINAGEDREKRWKRIKKFAYRYRLFEDDDIRAFIYKNRKEIKAGIRPSVAKHMLAGLLFLPLFMNPKTIVLGAVAWFGLAFLYRLKQSRLEDFRVDPKQRVEIGHQRYARLADERAARHELHNWMNAQHVDHGIQSKKYEKDQSHEMVDWADLRWFKVEAYAETKFWAELWSRYGKVHLRERDMAFLHGVVCEFEDFLTPRESGEFQEWAVWVVKGEGGFVSQSHLNTFKQRLPEVKIVEVRQADQGFLGLRIMLNSTDAEIIHHFWQEVGIQEKAIVYVKNYEETRTRCFWDCNAIPWN